VTERPEDRAQGAEDPERARIRKMLIERGVLPVHITERLIDYWIVQDAKDQEEARAFEEEMRRPGYRRPNPMYYGGGH
jgi:hypothetical protein